MLDSKADEMRREYLRQWRRDNRDKVRQYNKNYWQRKAERQLEEDHNNENCEPDQI